MFATSFRLHIMGLTSLANSTLTLRIQIAQCRYQFETLRPNVGIICIHGCLGFRFGLRVQGLGFRAVKGELASFLDCCQEVTLSCGTTDTSYMAGFVMVASFKLRNSSLDFPELCMNMCSTVALTFGVFLNPKPLNPRPLDPKL